MKHFFEFVTNSLTPDETVLSIYDEIGFWGTTAKDFRDKLAQVQSPNLRIHINSPGGNVIDGLAIYNQLKAHKANKTVVVDGVAASIASVIAMAGNTINMPANALMFIHNPMVSAQGDSADMRAAADMMDKMKQSLVGIYAARSGMNEKKVGQMMDSATWLSAEDCCTLGMCDTVTPELKVAAKYDPQNYFADDTILGRVRAALENPPGTTSGGQGKQPKQDTNMSFKTIEEATARVTSLEGEVSTLKTSAENSVKTARQEATNAAQLAEKTRKDGILAIQAKYNKNGDLDGIAVKALAGDTTAEAFKDLVLDVVQNRAATTAIKKTGGDNTTGFDAEYAAAKNFNERQAVLRKYPVEAREAARNK